MAVGIIMTDRQSKVFILFLDRYKIIISQTSEELSRIRYPLSKEW